MDILVTGGSGRVGRHVARHLARVGHDVTNLDLIPPPESLSDIPWVQCDILHQAALRECLRGRDAIVHLAGIPVPFNHPAEEVFHTNVVGTHHLLEAAAARRVPRFVFLSSESVLGFAFMERHMDPLYLPMDEAHPVRPQDAYGLSKQAAEAACQSVARRTGMEAVILRAPWIWTPDAEEVAQYRDLVANPGAWYRNMWSFCGVEDLAAAFDTAIRLPWDAISGAAAPDAAALDPAPAFFLCADENWTGRPTDRLLGEHYRLPERNSLRGASAVLSNARARKILGWTPVKTAVEYLDL